MLKCNDTGGLADLAPPAPAPTTDPDGGGSGGDA